MPLSGPTFNIQPTQSQPTLSTYITVFNVIAAGAGNAVEILGSASKTVAVSRIFLGKPSVGVTLVIRKQSAASTGASTTTTLVPLNSSSAVATAVAKQYTAVPAAGALVGEVYRNAVATTETATVVFAGTAQFQNGILNGVAETLAVNIDGAATIVGFIEWVEYS